MSDVHRERTATNVSKAEAHVYFSHVLALLVPGRTVETHAVASAEAQAVGDLAGWGDDDLNLLIDEGRRTFDGQAVRFDRVRTTAQVLLPTATAIAVVVASELPRIAMEHSGWLRVVSYVVWAIGAILVVGGALGAAAILTVQSVFGTLLPTLVSQQEAPIRGKVATAYAEQAIVGEQTIATRITVLRDATALVAIGGIVELVLLLIRTV